MARQVEKQDAPVSLERKLATAKAEATQARMHLDSLEAAIRTAAQEQRFDDAHTIKGQLPDAQHAWIEAESAARALEGVIAEVAQQNAAREAALQAEQRKAQAQANLAAAAERERELLDELSSLRAELVAGVQAVQHTMRRAYQVESATRQARADQARARVDSGETTGMPAHIAAANLVSSYVERSTALLAIMRGEALPS